MIEGIKMMARWHTVSFNALPISDGYDVTVNEFNHTDDNGNSYHQEGVVIGIVVKIRSIVSDDG